MAARRLRAVFLWRPYRWHLTAAQVAESSRFLLPRVLVVRALYEAGVVVRGAPRAAGAILVVVIRHVDVNVIVVVHVVVIAAAVGQHIAPICADVVGRALQCWTVIGKS